MRSITDMLMEYATVNKEICRQNEALQVAVKAQLNADGGIKASIMTDMPHGSGVGNPTYEKTANLFEHLEEICIELAELAETTKYEIRRLVDLKKDIDYAFMYLTYEERNIIKLRYIDYPEPKYTWDKVVSESYYCRSQCFEIHRRAIEKMEKVLNIGQNRTASGL
ncbi:MAG: RinA family protein [Clostridia bacterium]|nr:RinA family protein [Clostridia bacterium]